MKETSHSPNTDKKNFSGTFLGCQLACFFKRTVSKFNASNNFFYKK